MTGLIGPQSGRQRMVQRGAVVHWSERSRSASLVRDGGRRGETLEIAEGDELVAQLQKPTRCADAADAHWPSLSLTEDGPG